MGIIGITSAFLSVRKDRPPEYYSTPLEDFISKLEMGEPRMPVLVFSDNNKPRSLMRNQLVQVEYWEPDDLLRQFWLEKDWVSKYPKLKRLPGLDEIFKVNGLQLLSVWLGKFAMIKRGFELGYEAVFWFDSGHWTSHQHFADFSKYSESMLNKVTCKNLVKHLLAASQKYGILCTQAWPSLKELHIPLEAYYKIGREMGYKKPENLPLYQGVFLLIHKDKFDEFFTKCQLWWERLINDGYGGTEESAITILGWEKRIERISYINWIRILEGQNITDKLLDFNPWD